MCFIVFDNIRYFAIKYKTQRINCLSSNGQSFMHAMKCICRNSLLIYQMIFSYIFL